MVTIITTTETANMVMEVDGDRLTGYWLTRCCDAAVTGVCEGVACKGCYRKVNPVLGFCWDWNDIHDLSALVDHVEALLPDLDTEWAFKLVHSSAQIAVRRSREAG